MLSVAVLAVLGRGVIPADTPFLKADDLGLARGDGIFETMNVRGRQPWLLDDHLARLRASAASLGLVLPAADELVELVEQACAAWPADQEGAIKLVCTRGSESVGVPTVFAFVTPVPPRFLAARDNGVSIKTLCLGYPAEARKATPWLLAGAKTLSYAVNMASQRFAQANGADDALWVSTDGWALEAPTSSLVWRAGDELLTVPPRVTGILPGITARYALDHAKELGLIAAERMVKPTELHEADGVWLLSSVRGIAPINSIDGVSLRAGDDTPRLRALLGF